MSKAPSSQSTSLVTIFLLLAGSAASASASGPGTGITGTVLDAGTLQPIGQARVSVQASTATALSRPNGNFNLVDAVGVDLVVVGATAFVQWIAEDAAIPLGMGLSDALALWIQP